MTRTQFERMKQKFGGVWGQHPDYPVADWQAEIENNDTRLGYWEWVEHQRAGDFEDCDCANRSWYGPNHDSACPVTIREENAR